MADIATPTLDDPKDSWLVYADALQSAGDARGELIMLSAAVADGSGSSDRDAYLERHADELFGSLAPHRAKLDIDWQWCVPRVLSVEIEPQDDAKALVQAVLDSPLGTTMQTLRIVAQTPRLKRVELGPALGRVSEQLPPSCTGLELIDARAKQSRILVSSDYDPGRNLVEFGSLNMLWAIPHLQKLHLYVADTAQIKLGKIDAPQLRDFALLGLRWAEPYGGPTSMSEAFAAASWPKLERLALRIPETLTYSWPDQYGAYVPVDRYEEENEYYEDYGDDGWGEPIDWSAELGGLLDSLKKTEIEQLSLTSFASSAQLLEALETHGLPATLETLDLSESDLSDEDAGWIAAHARLFAGLKTLDLRDTLIQNPDPLEALAPEVLHSAGGGAIYRFAVGME